jgi:hypothetical protein
LRAFFSRRLAIARLGGSDKPLDCFVWDSDKSVHGVAMFELLTKGDKLAGQKKGKEIPFFYEWDK